MTKAGSAGAVVMAGCSRQSKTFKLRTKNEKVKNEKTNIGSYNNTRAYSLQGYS